MPRQGLEQLAQWVNPEYLSPSMVEQCAEAFSDNGSTVQLHRFLKVIGSAGCQAATGSRVLSVSASIIEEVRPADGLRGATRSCNRAKRVRLEYLQAFIPSHPGPGLFPCDVLWAACAYRCRPVLTLA